MNKKHIITAVGITFVSTLLLCFIFGSALLLNTGAGNGLAQKIQKIDYFLDKYYIEDMDRNAMEDMALTGYVYGVGDTYTSYIGKDDYENLQATIYGDYTGIGIEVYVDPADNMITVLSALDDTPAQKAGIMQGDKIAKIEGTKVSGENYYEAINMIKGVTQTQNKDRITLTVIRDGSEFDKEVKRETIKNISVKEKVIENDLGYIRISKFSEDTDKEFDAAYKSLSAQNIKGLIIDLRDNPGGVLDAVVEVADAILPEGTIVSVKDKQGNEKKYPSDKNEIDLPICILVNSGSASASEVLSGAVRDFKKGTLVGETTFGKGLVQSIFEFGDNTAIKITTAKYYTPSGECIQGTGIKPDVEVALPEDLNVPVQSLTLDQDVQLQKAIEILNQG